MSARPIIVATCPCRIGLLRVERSSRPAREAPFLAHRDPHDENKEIPGTSRNTVWLICRLEFNGRKCGADEPGELHRASSLGTKAVALAAGHRPWLASVAARATAPISRLRASTTTARSAHLKISTGSSTSCEDGAHKGRDRHSARGRVYQAF